MFDDQLLLKKIADIADCSVEEVIEVVSHFRRQDRGFVMPPEGVELTGESILDISHESLMRVWGRLKEWVDEEGESSILYARITDSAKGYEKERAGLWRDPDLQISLDWLSKYKPNNTWASQYNDSFDSAIRFIEASDFQLVEALAERSAAIILKEFPVNWLKLKLGKPGAVRGSTAVGVIIERGRTGDRPA